LQSQDEAVGEFFKYLENWLKNADLGQRTVKSLDKHTVIMPEQVLCRLIKYVS